MELLEYLQYGFIQRALLCGAFIALLCSTLGVILVLRRFSLIGDGLAHVTFGSVALGLLFRIYPLYISIPIVMLSSLGILRVVKIVGRGCQEAIAGTHRLPCEKDQPII
jgi:zinc transport system permease protein